MEIADEPIDRLGLWEKRTEWPLAAVAVIFLVAYSLQVLARPEGDSETVLIAVVAVTWLLFAVDYVCRLMLSTQRLRWFSRHLLDLAIVALPILRPLRLLRLVIVIGVFHNVVGAITRGRVIVYTVASAILLVYVASLAILEAERPQPDSGIKTFGEALWWSITTVTTVGYGDYAPVSATGRMIAVLLMLGGISLIGVVTATLASWIVQRVAEEDTANQLATAEQLDLLRSELAELKGLLAAAKPEPSPGNPRASPDQALR
ncbi:potassium channel family protein [Williamsia sp.]|uniref:potassium channel family protein n=1 Tax=Williamsia sp. TaxID=1872085 RepID=UPI002F93D9FA